MIWSAVKGYGLTLVRINLGSLLGGRGTIFPDLLCDIFPDIHTHLVGGLPRCKCQIRMTGRRGILGIITIQPDIDDASPDCRVQDRGTHARKVLALKEPKESQGTLAGIAVIEWAGLPIAYQPEVILIWPPHPNVINPVKARTQSLVDLVEILCVDDDNGRIAQ